MFPPNQEQSVFDLRWRFDYLSRPAKYGQWSRPDERDEDKAYRQNKEGLLLASIEGKNRKTFEVVTLCDVPATEFVMFEWMAAASMRPFFNGTAKTRTQLLGLAIKTREHILAVYPDGSVHKTDRTEAEKAINYQSYGK